MSGACFIIRKDDVDILDLPNCCRNSKVKLLDLQASSLSLVYAQTDQWMQCWPSDLFSLPQMIRYSSPSIDLARVFGSCTSPKYRERHLEKLLTFYHNIWGDEKGLLEKLCLCVHDWMFSCCGEYAIIIYQGVITHMKRTISVIQVKLTNFDDALTMFLKTL